MKKQIRIKGILSLLLLVAMLAGCCASQALA